MSERTTTDWAFNLLRPILQELKVQELEETPRYVKASSYRNLIINGMERWVVIARQFSFKDESRGFVQIVLDKTHDLFLLIINIDKDLFINNSLNLRTQRKMIAVHEFVHGAAHIFLSTFIKPERYIELMDKSMIAKVKMTSSEEFNEMLSAIGKLGIKGGTKEVFSDGHYRLLEDGFMDGFMGNFTELYIYLLLSYQLVCETMTAIKKRHEAVNSTKISISELLTLTINELTDKKALDKDFVLGRIKLFLPMLFLDFV